MRMLIQFFLTCVLAVGVGLTWRRFRQQVIRLPEMCGWFVLWIGAIVLVWRPGTSTVIAHVFGIGRGVDFILYVAVSFLLISVFQLHIAHERLERTLTKLIRHEALKDLSARKE